MKALEAHKDPHKEVRCSFKTDLDGNLRAHKGVVGMLCFCLYMDNHINRINTFATLLYHYVHHIDAGDSFFCGNAVLIVSFVIVKGGTSGRGDGSHVGIVHQSRPVYQGVVSHHPVSRLPHQPGCHQDADQSGGEGSPWGSDQPAAWDSARTHTGKTHRDIPSFLRTSTNTHECFLWPLCFEQSLLRVCNVNYRVDQGYDNSESSVRKACVFCLVAIYAVIGEDLKPHLSQLSSSKVTYELRNMDLIISCWLKICGFS